MRVLSVALSWVLWSLATVAVLPAVEDSNAAPNRAPAEPAEATAPEPVLEPAAEAPPAVTLVDRLLVVGDAVAARTVPGSAQVLDEEVLRRQAHGDIHRILQLVPGVNVQDEEGYGLRPNIGIRGTGLERAERVTLLEDGVLIAPAPYSAPAAYYFPVAGRMEAVEVRKGSAAIEQGPYSHGGAINLISSSVPTGRLAARLEAAAGEDSTLDLLGRAGGQAGRFGWLLEGVRRETDGFKRLDGGGETGFEISDYLGKLRWQGASGGIPQALELKLGRHRQTGNETYLGLAEEDFQQTPRRRYLASAADRIDTEHEQAQLRWMAQLNPRLDFTATAYRNDFFRNWYKLDSVEGRAIAAVLDAPATFGRQLAVLRGEVPSVADGLTLRANRRDYYAQGVQVVAGLSGELFGVDHELELGLRYHEDEEDRFQQDDRWTSSGTALRLTRAGTPGSQANQVNSAAAWAFHLRDRISFGRFTLSPGLRFESVDYRRFDYGRNDPERTGSALSRRTNGVDVVLPGVGLAYAATGETVVFAGLHRGFSPPGPGQATEVDAEESWNYELGARWARRRSRAELVAFVSDYGNLLGRDTLAGGGAGTGDLFNGGAALVRGVELGASTEIAGVVGGRFDLPLRASYTWTRATFESSFTTAYDAWAPAVERGDELPYIPEHQLAVGAGLSGERVRLFADLAWVGATRSGPGQGAIPAAERIDERAILDLSGEVTVLEPLALFLRVRNATDETAVVARRPAGLRPGLPRTVLAGFTWRFAR